MKLFLAAVLGIVSLSAFSQVKSEVALQYVPGGTIVQTKKDEVKVRTAKGSVVELEFTRSGELDEASGDMIESDTFVPGKGYLPLEKIAAAIKEQGFQLKGDWSYDKSMMKDWRYEIDAFQENQEYELVVDAKTAKIIDKHLDD